MAKEEKSLLLQDLSARLPYRVIVTDNRHGNSVITEIDTISSTVYCSDFDEYIPIEKCRPYLRPMSSMTFVEKREFLSIGDNNSGGFLLRTNKQDWLNAHHFDYRGLIEKGLALEAQEGMYDIKEK